MPGGRDGTDERMRRYCGAGCELASSEDLGRSVHEDFLTYYLAMFDRRRWNTTRQ